MTRPQVRALFVLPSFAGGGAERVALTLLRALDPQRFQGSLVVLDNRGPLRSLVSDTTPVTDLGQLRLRKAIGHLIAAIREINPDIVFSTLGYTNLAMLASRWVLPGKTRIVVREANMPSLNLPNTAHPAMYRAAYRFLYPRADVVICTSNQMIEEMRQDFKVDLSRLFLLPNPVDEVSTRRAALPIKRASGPGLRLVAAGRMTRQKGFDQLIQMMPGLEPDTHLTILGTGDGQADLESRVRDLGLDERIQFAGYQGNPWAYYAGADAFVMTSRWEGLPNSALEALACGTPIVASPESGAIAEIAAAAPPGAITIAAVGDSFIAALQDLSAADRFQPHLRSSLLPDQYRLPVVTRSFEDLLTRLSM